jgi:hypothetical protein
MQAFADHESVERMSVMIDDMDVVLLVTETFLHLAEWFS